MPGPKTGKSDLHLRPLIWKRRLASLRKNWHDGSNCSAEIHKSTEKATLGVLKNADQCDLGLFSPSPQPIRHETIARATRLSADIHICSFLLYIHQLMSLNPRHQKTAAMLHGGFTTRSSKFTHTIASFVHASR